jgi:hypothetical protein
MVGCSVELSLDSRLKCFFLFRFQEKIVEQLEEARREEEEERLARLGPGGLDPMEVFESLPDVSLQ